MGKPGKSVEVYFFALHRIEENKIFNLSNLVHTYILIHMDRSYCKTARCKGNSNANIKKAIDIVFKKA